MKERFETIFASENDMLFRFCLWRTSDRELAVEFTQETFARFWQEMVRGKEIPNVRAFLFLVAKRLIIDWYRKNKPYSLDRVAEGEEEPMFEAGDDNKAASEADVLSDASRAVALIDELDERYREVVYLRFVEDLPPRDIALMLGLTANAVSVRLTRGIEALRQLFGIRNKE